ncbi:MAG TPA: universal stress protein [Noviherbaspirillum sp.]|nr:universal stress protein [Noviherbaspirillum sp.]
MNDDNAMQIVLPFVDAASAKTVLPVARAIARSWNASLHVLATERQLAAVQDFLQQMTQAPGENETLPMVVAAGELVEATIHEVASLKQAMVVLAIRIRDDVPENQRQAIDILGCQMLEKIPCPILLVPPEQDMAAWQLRRELLPQDGTPTCAAALARIIRQSASREVENLVLRVAGANVGQPTAPGSLPTPRYVDHPQYEWEAWGKEFLERVDSMGLKPGTAGMRLMMANGDPASEILRISEEKSVDMIILPWHRVLRSGRARMVKAVLQRAACPVLLVPQRRERHGQR